eukprot:2477814-Rhodomonas_salina.1
MFGKVAEAKEIFAERQRRQAEEEDERRREAEARQQQEQDTAAAVLMDELVALSTISVSTDVCLGRARDC